MKKNSCNRKSSEIYCLDCKECLIMKYVRNDFTDFVFSPLHINHSDLVIDNKKPLSAGFINFSKMETFGESIGLGISPKPDDIDIIIALFKM